MKCRKCKRNLPKRSFVNPRNKSGFSTSCISCRKLKGAALSDDVFQFFGKIVDKIKRKGKQPSKSHIFFNKNGDLEP